ncbi:hypothetical protein Pcinc_004932 [Petrolisthes cinctipes]|uniref:Retinol dehydrogenase 11 n=1 Tax=Petrolisthes cinctipes TaxID=88211 RepID=A0AAE1GG70_PETCI|nr:hypothetical protein Pcinc_004932 [Petrolisthes cinctipes]KAK3891140.1 hypothetical protein Pcinc_004932 [Petrolisthes cinctipes]
MRCLHSTRYISKPVHQHQPTLLSRTSPTTTITTTNTTSTITITSGILCELEDLVEDFPRRPKDYKTTKNYRREKDVGLPATRTYIINFFYYVCEELCWNLTILPALSPTPSVYRPPGYYYWRQCSGVRMLFEVLVTLVVLVVSVRVWNLTTSGRCHSTRSMKGKTVIVTGGSAGIGLHTAEDLVRRGARVILACRNLEKAYKVAAQLKAKASQGGEVAVRRLDTSDLNSVRTFAKEILDTEKHIHVLINNAGILEPPEKVMTNEGLELTMATNHFGHFLLTNLLLERLKQSAPSRIVNVSSLFHTLVSSLDLNSLNFEKEVYRRRVPYNRSKLCNVLFSLELARRLEGSGVTANSLHPGYVKTDILVPYHTIRGMIMKLLFILWAKDSELGAQTNIYLAVSEEVEGVSGQYFIDCKEVKTSKLARDKDLAKRLWEVSEKAVKLRPEEKFC